MTGGLFGEITADGLNIVLFGTGDDHEQNQMGTILRHMTPLLSQTDPPGGLLCPLTWAAVTQLGYSFRSESTGQWLPQPKLTQWIIDEFTRRHAATKAQPANEVQHTATAEQPASDAQHAAAVVQSADDHEPAATVDQPARVHEHAARAPGPAKGVQPAATAVQPANGLVPRSYQLDAARQIASMGKFLLFDEPGPQPVTTPVWTPDGWTAIGELKPGDLVYDSDGAPVPVMAVRDFGRQPVYRVTFSDRSSTLATGNHRWHVWTRNDRKRDTGGRIMSTDQLLGAGLRLADGLRNYYLPQQPVLNSPDHELLLDPYAYGALLGNGRLGTVYRGGNVLGITCPDNETLIRVATAVTALGTTWKWNTPADRCQNLAFHRNGKLREILAGLDALHYSKNKSVHPVYLRAGTAARRSVLAGLLDTDGNVAASAGVEFSSASPQLAADVAWLARSLGAVVTEADPQPASYRRDDGVKVRCLLKHRLHMRFPADGPNPFTLSRKADEWARQAIAVQRRNPPRLFDAIEPAGEADVCCIELNAASTHVYLTDTALIPTHNCGKTVSTILGLQAWQREHELFPMVVVVPSWDVADVWTRHIADWAPGWPEPVMYGGTDRARHIRLKTKILVTTYATARLDAADAKGPLVKLKAAAVVLDESHAVKNTDSQQSKAVTRIAAKADAIVALTGTPVTRDTGDIFPVLAAMDPRSYPSRGRFVKRYLATADDEYGETIEGLAPLAEPEFRTVLAGQYRRVSKADVAGELPPKIYSVRRIEIPPQWRTAYDGMAADMLAELPDGEELEVMSVLAQLTRLSQLASSACDVEVTEEPDELTGELRKHYHVTLKAPSWKADVLLEILAERPGQQVAVFAESRQLIVIAGLACEKAGYRCGYITGGMAKGARQRAIDGFQGRQLDVILCTSGAGGLGITLTAAGTAVFLQRSWSLDKAIQPEDRLHRIGQEHEAVEIIDVVARDTIDQRVRTLLREKAGSLGQLVRDPRITRELLGGLR